MPFLSDIANLAQGLNPLITGALSSASQSRATNNLVAGGQQGINTIQTGAQNAQNTLATNLQAQKTALAPFVNPGAQAATTISNMQPYTPQTFNWTPADIANDPAYQFRLQQGQAAIDAEGNAAGTRFSGATLKDLSQFNTGEAAQAEQQDYQRQLGTFQTNQGNQLSAYQTNLGAQQNLEAQGLNAQGQVTSTANTTANATANIQTSSAQQIAELQTQIANAQAAGNIAQAAQLQNTLTSLLNGAPAAVKSLNSLLNPTATNSTANPANVANGTDPNNPNNSGANSGTGLNPAGPASGTTTMYGPDGSAVNVPTDQAAQFQQAGYSTTQPQQSYGFPATTALPAAAGAGVAAATGAGSTAAALTPVTSVVIPGVTDATAATAAAGAGEAAATGAGTAAGEASAAATTGASSGVLSSIGAFMTNPITIGVGAALLAGYAIIKALQVHPTADQFVQGTQNPFVNAQGTGALNKVVDGFDSALKSGQLSQSDATALRTQTANLIQQFQAAGQQFASQGSKQATVWKQAQQTMATDFGGTNGVPDYSGILGKMDSEIAALPAQAA